MGLGGTRVIIQHGVAKTENFNLPIAKYQSYWLHICLLESAAHFVFFKKAGITLGKSGFIPRSESVTRPQASL